MDTVIRAPGFYWPFWVGVALYAALRLALLPTEGSCVHGFGHDSAYIALVANNLLAGRGFVNDAHWLVFLQPAGLPMPYHNANPLYPTLTAAVAWLSGHDTVWAGLAVSALASTLLLAGLFCLVLPFVPKPWHAAALAAAGTFFPAVFDDSLFMLPDALCTALLAWAAAALVRGPRLGMTILAGTFFGLAWLTRSSAVFALPAVFAYVWLRPVQLKLLPQPSNEEGNIERPPGARPLRLAIGRIAIFLVSALIVASPWLIHSAVTWGDPFRSDAGYYLLQDYHARSHDDSTEKYWHCPSAPPGLTKVLANDPSGFATFYAQGIPILLYSAVAGWTASKHAVAGLMAALLAIAAWRLRGRLFYLPEMAALLVYAVTIVLGFALRARSLELRYLAPISIMLAMLLGWVVIDALSAERKGISGWLALALGVGWWLIWTPFQDYQRVTLLGAIDNERVAYRSAANQVNTQFTNGQPIIVGYYPYLYTHATGSPSLAIPSSDDAYLLDYMKRYSAKHVFLTLAERDFWRPHWQRPGDLPPYLQLVEANGYFVLYERVEIEPSHAFQPPEP